MWKSSGTCWNEPSFPVLLQHHTAAKFRSENVFFRRRFTELYTVLTVGGHTSLYTHALTGNNTSPAEKNARGCDLPMVDYQNFEASF